MVHFQCYTFLPYINDHARDVICNIAIYADDSTLYSNCDQASDLWQQIELAFELESDLRDTVDWGRKWFVDFSLITLVLLIRKWMGLFLYLYFEMQGLSFYSRLV